MIEHVGSQMCFAIDIELHALFDFLEYMYQIDISFYPGFSDDEEYATEEGFSSVQGGLYPGLDQRKPTV